MRAPTTSNRPGRRGVSVTKRRASARTAMPIGTLMNSVQRHEPRSVTTPPSSRPIDAPAEETAPKRASARFRAASSGALVVSRASTLGAAIAAPAPCRARARTSWVGVCARPPSSEKTVNMLSPISNIRSRPRTSPRRPPSSRRPAEGERVGVEHPRQRGRPEAEVGVDPRAARRSRRWRPARASAGPRARSRSRWRPGRRWRGARREGRAGSGWRGWCSRRKTRDGSCSGPERRAEVRCSGEVLRLEETIRRQSPFGK